MFCIVLKKVECPARTPRSTVDRCTGGVLGGDPVTAGLADLAHELVDLGDGVVLAFDLPGREVGLQLANRVGDGDGRRLDVFLGDGVGVLRLDLVLGLLDLLLDVAVEGGLELVEVDAAIGVLSQRQRVLARELLDEVLLGDDALVGGRRSRGGGRRSRLRRVRGTERRSVLSLRVAHQGRDDVGRLGIEEGRDLLERLALGRHRDGRVFVEVGQSGDDVLEGLLQFGDDLVVVVLGEGGEVAGGGEVDAHDFCFLFLGVEKSAPTVGAEVVTVKRVVLRHPCNRAVVGI